MISRHVIYCDHYPDGAGEAGSNARERKPATVSHEFNDKTKFACTHFYCPPDFAGFLIGMILSLFQVVLHLTAKEFSQTMCIARAI